MAIFSISPFGEHSVDAKVNWTKEFTEPCAGHRQCSSNVKREDDVFGPNNVLCRKRCEKSAVFSIKPFSSQRLDVSSAQVSHQTVVENHLCLPDVFSEVPRIFQHQKCKSTCM